MKYTILKPEDLEVLERLMELPLEDECRKSLMRMYGEDGYRSKYLREQMQEHPRLCPKDCFMCGACIPELEGSLLFLITSEMKCYIDYDTVTASDRNTSGIVL